jgi:hypothetical protein
MVGFLVAIFAAERYVEHNDLLLSTPESALARRVSWAAKEEAPRCDILFLGDSLLRFGAIPQVFEAQSHRKAYNLAHVGGQPAGAYFLLRRAVRYGARPAAIVVDFKANCIAANPFNLPRQWMEMLTLRECAELALSGHNTGQLAHFALGKLLPSVKARLEIRSFAVAALKRRLSVDIYEPAVYLRNANRNQGAIVINEDHSVPWPRKEYLDATYFPPAWDIHPLNALYLRKLIALASAHGIRVFWALPPIRSEIQAKRDEGHLDDLYLRRAYWLFARFSNVTLIDGRHAGYPASAFFDPAHLRRSGALALSTALAQTVRAALERPGGSARVLELPQYRPVVFEPVPEDLATSRIAMTRAAETVRR